MSDRYFSLSPILGETARLTGVEAHHLASVMRAGPGDLIVLFDGSGVECEASIIRISKREVELQIESRREVDREPNTQLTLAIALPKGDRQKWLIEKAVELGVANLTPIVTQRSVVKLKESGRQRLQRSVVEASKQCGRNRLMEIAPPVDWIEFASRTPDDGQRIIAHPGMVDSVVAETAWGQNLIAAIGPEGGFADEEVESAVDFGWQAMSLGPRILRIETAALKLAALLLRD
jgi:16S rRNA (uracil1498-N3)-methyltransferase